MATGKESDAALFGNTDALYRTLSAFRGVLIGVGVDIADVVVSHASRDAKLNKAITKHQDKRTERREHKIAALVQTLCDKLYIVGYHLDSIDLREMEPGEMKTTEWKMNVFIKEMSA